MRQGLLFVILSASMCHASFSLSQVTKEVSNFSPKVISVPHCSSIALLATMNIQRKEMEVIRRDEKVVWHSKAVCLHKLCLFFSSLNNFESKFWLYIAPGSSLISLLCIYFKIWEN